ncbi:MAG: hypothetical protein AAF551_03745 [Bacteroidota bacterium]
MLQPPPPDYKEHIHKFSFHVPHTSDKVWKWLNNTKTFTDTQVWPYKVEFYSPEPDKIPNGFHEKVLTNHTGPFVNFAGKLTSITTTYRELQYFYGSYAFSFRLIRPYRLEFWTSENESSTTLTCAMSSYVKPGVYKIWNTAQKIFWKRFVKWASRSISKIN